METTQQPGFVIIGKEQVEAASILALRSALRLEARGMKRRGCSALSIARDRGLTKARTSAKALEDLNVICEGILNP